ncbi:MAG: hypothetical protein B7Z49_03025, partial [Hydrogenophilales bacterium 12-63-5]
MATLLVVAIDRTMSPPHALPCEKIHPFHFVPLFLIHDTSPMKTLSLTARISLLFAVAASLVLLTTGYFLTQVVERHLKEEDRVTEDLELVPISVYNKTKMVAERVLLSYADKMQVQCVRPATVCGYSPRMRLDVAVNMLTFQALKNKRITVFGGDQTRPNIHIEDLVDVYMHLLAHPEIASGCYNAGFENISILEIANRVTEVIPAEVIVSESNDPRSYRLDSSKLLATGFSPKRSVG